jgi:alpha-galactosidase
VNLDDCWSLIDRDPSTGYINTDLEKFPNGINGLAEKIHDLGLKIGIYASASLHTCQGRAGSLFHEETDARAFAEWGIDCMWLMDTRSLLCLVLTVDRSEV